jgi:hypothetical protein
MAVVLSRIESPDFPGKSGPLSQRIRPLADFAPVLCEARAGDSLYLESSIRVLDESVRAVSAEAA